MSSVNWYKVIATYSDGGTVQFKTRSEDQARVLVARLKKAGAQSEAETGRMYYSKIEVVPPEVQS